ncbi:MAG: pyridoxal-phosphate dependent enzyme [Pseudomonadota bacterium]
MPLHIETPQIESPFFHKAPGSGIVLKLEALQPPGSFKIRGIGAACEQYAREGKKRFVSSSGGNAGMAAAYAGMHLSLPVTVVVPETTTSRAIELLKHYDADVIVHGPSWAEADTYARSLLDDKTAYIHPFDDPLLWSGYATMIDEVARTGLRPDNIVLSVGGGGLLCGVIEGIRRNDWSDVAITTVETTGSASLEQSVRAGERIELAAIESIASSLGAKKVCEQAFLGAQSRSVECVSVSDLEAVKACSRFLIDHRVLVEPACGAALAWVYKDQLPSSKSGTTLVIVCGGATVTPDQLQTWEQSLSDH